MYIEIGKYDVNNRLAIRLYKKNGEDFGDLTKNLPFAILEKNEVFINECNTKELLDCFKKVGIIKKHCGKVQYNMGEYEKVELDLKKLEEYDYLGYNHILGKYKPFDLYSNPKSISIVLDQYNYYYDWVSEEKVYDTAYSDGHCYNDLFNDYLNNNHPELNSKLNYDSENGMFCTYCKDEKVADEVAKILSDLYNDEEKMIELIKETKKNHNYEFDIKI